MCLCMFMVKQAVGVQLGDDMVQGVVDGQEPVQDIRTLGVTDIGRAGGDGDR